MCIGCVLIKMSEIQRINITLPKKLISRSKVLIDEGIYNNFSELVRESLKNEIVLETPLIEKKKILDRIFEEEGGKGEDTSHLSKEELIAKIRKMREDQWDIKYKKWFKR